MWEKIKRLFCRHTWVPSTTLGHHICVDCCKLKKK